MNYQDWLRSWQQADPVLSKDNNLAWDELDLLDPDLFLAARQVASLNPRLTCKAAVKRALEAQATT